MNRFLEMWSRVFQGRVSRIQFLKGMLAVGFSFGLVTLLYVYLVSPELLDRSPLELVGALRSTSSMWSLFPLYFLQGIFSVGLSVRRIKDCNLSPFFIFVSFLPYMNIPFFFFLLLKKGSSGVNQYGPAPINGRSFMQLILNN